MHERHYKPYMLSSVAMFCWRLAEEQSVFTRPMNDSNRITRESVVVTNLVKNHKLCEDGKK